jgi:hypothetical protein
MQRYLEERQILSQTINDLAGIFRQNEIVDLAQMLERVRLASTLQEAASVLREEINNRRDSLSDTTDDTGEGWSYIDFPCSVIN